MRCSIKFLEYVLKNIIPFYLLKHIICVTLNNKSLIEKKENPNFHISFHENGNKFWFIDMIGILVFTNVEPGKNKISHLFFLISFGKKKKCHIKL